MINFSQANQDNLPRLIGSIGAANFGQELLAYLHRICGADHCSAYHVETDNLWRLASFSSDGTDEAQRNGSAYASQQYWRRDPLMCDAKTYSRPARPLILRIDVEQMADIELRERIYPRIRERLVLLGHDRGASFSLSVLRSHSAGQFSETDVARLQASAELLVSLVARHGHAVTEEHRFLDALTNLATIEECILSCNELSRREAEVCARILLGVSTDGIALDLGLGRESIKTYRKRAYTRLNIGCERELLTWYVRLFGDCRRHRASAALLH